MLHYVMWEKEGVSLWCPGYNIFKLLTAYSKLEDHQQKT
jgi:hypothetical protein